MSLVGPRPLGRVGGRADRRLVADAARPRARRDRPLAGARPHRHPFRDMVSLDYVYVTNWSLWLDIKLIARTVPVVLIRRGAKEPPGSLPRGRCTSAEERLGLAVSRRSPSRPSEPPGQPATSVLATGPRWARRTTFLRRSPDASRALQAVGLVRRGAGGRAPRTGPGCELLSCPWRLPEPYSGLTLVDCGFSSTMATTWSSTRPPETRVRVRRCGDDEPGRLGRFVGALTTYGAAATSLDGRQLWRWASVAARRRTGDHRLSSLCGHFTCGQAYGGAGDDYIVGGVADRWPAGAVTTPTRSRTTAGPERSLC